MELPMSLQPSDFEDFLESERLSRKTDDPEETPFLSKYKARKILQAIELKLKMLYLNDKSQPSRNLNLISSFAYILYKLGVNYCETEERAASEAALKDAALCLVDFGKEPPLIFVHIAVQNYLSFIYSSRSENDKALEHLLLAKEAYEHYKQYKSDSLPLDSIQCFKECCHVIDNDNQSEVDLWLRLEQLYTYTLFYLAQLYKNMERFEESALYCHETLVRQLNYGDYDSLEWALNSATLSQYYINNPKLVNFTVARQCIASAMAILDGKIEESATKAANLIRATEPNQLSQPGNKANDEEASNKDKIEQCKADVNRCFAKYGLALLEASKDNFFGDNNEKVDITDRMDEDERIMFEKLDFQRYESLITDKLATNFEQARSIFLAVQNWLNKAKQYYALDGHASDFIEITQDFNRLFKLLSFFESDPNRKRAMTKRRFDLLDGLLKQLNPRYYLTQCRQLYFDLADISTELLESKLDEAENEAQGRPDVRLVSKINQLAQRALNFYDLFLQSYKRSDSDEMPEKFDRSHARPVIVARLSMARLCNKMLTGEKERKLAFCQKTLSHLQWIVRYCECVDPAVLDLVKGEYEVAKEMLELYTVKLDRLRSL